MSPVQELHEWCNRHGYDYRFDSLREVFRLKRRGGLHDFMVSCREIAQASPNVAALLYALTDRRGGQA